GEKTVWIDCDVIQADGGTRTASITGAFVAMTQAIAKLGVDKPFVKFPVTDYLAATSVGKLENIGAVFDLNYVEDSSEQVDMNVIMTGAVEFVKLEGTGEEEAVSR